MEPGSCTTFLNQKPPKLFRTVKTRPSYTADCKAQAIDLPALAEPSSKSPLDQLILQHLPQFYERQ